MVIKDVYCLACGEVTAGAWLDSCDWVGGALPCPTCTAETDHAVMCNGGVKLKPYICSYDGRDWSGDVQHLGIQATYADGTPVTEPDGSRSDVRYRSDFDSRIRDKRDQKQSATNRALGKSPLHFDQGATSAP